MDARDKKEDFEIAVNKLINEEKFGEAINYLQKIVEKDDRNERAIAYMEQIKKILEYQNRDIFGSTNLDMDPWLE